MATFNGIDYAIIILLFLSVTFGIARGFVREIISLLAWVAAFVVSALYAVKVAAIFSGVPEHVAHPIESVTMASIIISYLSLFVGVLVCGSIVKLIANYIVASSGLGLINRFFGAVFGLARGCVIVLIAMFFISFTALATHSLWKDSKLVAVFHPGVKWLDHVAQPYVTEIQAKMKKTAKNINQEDLSDVIKPKSAPLATEPKPAATPSSPASGPTEPSMVKTPVAPGAATTATPATPAAATSTTTPATTAAPSSPVKP